LIILCPSELQAARQDKFQAQAYYGAEAGIVKAVAEIENSAASGNVVKDSPGSDTSTRAPFQVQNLWVKVTITLVPDHGVSALYRVVSGVYLSQADANADNTADLASAVLTLDAHLLQDSFSKFGYYSDNENGLPWRTGYEIDGPAHTNDNFLVALTDTTTPIFMGPTVSRGIINDVNYSPLDSATLDNVTNQNPITKYSGFSEINLPSSTGKLRDLVWNGSSPMPTVPGVYVQGGDLGNKGVFIQGNVDSMAFNGSGFTIIQGTTKYELYVPYNSNGKISSSSCLATTNSSGRNMTNLPNLGKNLGQLVIYCNGDINNLSGTNYGQKVIVANVEAGKKITISGDIWRADTPHVTQSNVNDPQAKPTGCRDALGLVAQDIVVKENTAYDACFNNFGSAGGSPIYSHPMYNVDIYAVLMAGRKDSNGQAIGGFGAENAGTRAAAGYINIYGGLIQANRQAVGASFNGFRRRVFYDPYAAQALSMFYPPLSKFHVVGIQTTANYSGGNVRY